MKVSEIVVENILDQYATSDKWHDAVMKHLGNEYPTEKEGFSSPFVDAFWAMASKLYRNKVDPLEASKILQKRINNEKADQEKYNRPVKRNSEDDFDYTDYSMQQGELGNPDYREEVAWDREKEDY